MKTAHVVGRFLTVLADVDNDPDNLPDQVPLQGTVTFTPSVTALLDTSGTTPATVLPSPITATLDGAGDVAYNGTKGVKLTATDDPDTNPTGWTYTVSFNLKGPNGIRVNYNSYAISLPADVTTDLTLVARVPSSTGIGLTRGVGVEKVTSGNGALIFHLTDRTTHEVSVAGILVTSVNGQSGAAVVGDVRAEDLVDEASEARVALDGIYADKATQDGLVAEVAALPGDVDEKLVAQAADLEAAITAANTANLTSSQEYVDGKLVDEVTRANGAYAPANVLNNAVTSINGQKGAVSIPVSDDTTITAIAKNSASALRTEIKAITDAQVADPLSKKLDKTEASTTYATNTSVTTELELRVNPLVDQRLASDSTVKDAAAIAVQDELAGGITGEIITVIDDEKQTGGIISTSRIEDDEILFTITDGSGLRSWLETNTQGRPTAHAAELVKDTLGITGAEPIVGESNYLLAFTDEEDRIAGGFLTDGTFRLEKALVAPEETDTGIDTTWLPITGWGTSMMHGSTGAGTTLLTVIRSQLGLDSTQVLNRGGNGMRSPGIAASQGGAPVVLTVANNTIPASGTVTVNAGALHADTFWYWAGIGAVSGTLAGVKGTLSHPSATDTTLDAVFTRTGTGTALKLDGPRPFLPDWGPTTWGNGTILWIGRNDMGKPDQIMANYAAITKRLDHDKFLIISELNGTDPDGLNNRLAATYPWAFVDLKRWLIDNGLAHQGITPTTQDTADIAANTVPTSLRSDALHLNAAGYRAAGYYVSTIITSKGWI